MAKKFAEHNGLNLTQTNQEVLRKWGEEDVFTAVSPSAKAVLSTYTSRVLPRQTDTPVFTMCWHEPSRIHSTVTRR